MAEEGTPLPTNQQCTLCGSESNLSRCKGCQVSFYCGREHQTSDWPTHKTLCNPIKKTRAKLDARKEELENHPGDWGMQARPFENSAGRFWARIKGSKTNHGILDTRDYMRARFGHVEALLKVRNRAAVQAALDHLLDMMRLNRSDNMGLRQYAPAQFLRLGKDQECYDFLKWWSTTGNDMHYDWGDLSAPHLNLRDEDVFEWMEDFNNNHSDLSHAAMLCLIKLRLLLDLRAVQNAATAIGTRLPQELLDAVNSQMLSMVVKSNRAVMQDVEKGNDLSPYVQKVDLMAKALYLAIEERSPYYWEALLDPEADLAARPASYSSGSREEMQLSLQQTFDAWRETPGAIAWVREMFETELEVIEA